MTVTFSSVKFQKSVRDDSLALARSEVSAFAHRGLEIINGIIKVKTGRLRFSVGGNFATGHNGGDFIPPLGTVQRAAPIGLSIDLAVLMWEPGDGLSSRSLLKYAHQVGDTFQIAEAMLTAEAA